MRDDRDKLLDMLEAIEKIEERTGGGKDAFRRDEMIQVWVLYHVQVIGEAASRISAELRIETSTCRGRTLCRCEMWSCITTLALIWIKYGMR